LSFVLLAHRRQRETDPPPGSQRDKSLTVRPGPKAFHAETLEKTVGAGGRFATGAENVLDESEFLGERTEETSTLCLVGRIATAKNVSRGTPQGRGGS
jgi:hypothetical protein